MFDLKARQLGGTTGVAAYAFWHAYFKPNFKVGVMAQSRESAEQIFEIYRRFYDNMPKWMTFPTKKANVRELLWFHGGMVRVFTANTQSARGTTYNFLHCSEFAFYSDVERTIQSAFQTATPDAIVVMETTANGLNYAHDLWSGENGYKKVFLPWTKAKEYSISTRPPGLGTTVPTRSTLQPARWRSSRPVSSFSAWCSPMSALCRGISGMRSLRSTMSTRWAWIPRQALHQGTIRRSASWISRTRRSLGA